MSFLDDIKKLTLKLNKIKQKSDHEIEFKKITKLGEFL